MTGDAKLGLLLGIGVVVAAALVFYRPEGTKSPTVKAEVQINGRPVQLSPSPKLTTKGE